MHSSTFTISQQEFQDNAEHMIKLLQDQTRLLYKKDAKDGAAKIKEIKDSQSFTITTDAEFRVLRDRALELQKQNESMNKAVENLQKECEALEGMHDDVSKISLAQLVEEIDQKQASLKELESTFNKLNSFASRKTELNEKMKKYTEGTRSCLHLTKQFIKEVRNKYQHIENNKDFIENEMEKYQTDEERYEALINLSRKLVEENEGLKADTIIFKDKEESMSQQIAELELRLEESQTKNNILEKEVRDIKNKYDELLSEKSKCDMIIKQMETEIKTHTEYAKQLQNQVDEMNTELQTAQAKYTDLVTEKDKLAEEYLIRIKNLQQKAETLNQQLDDSELRNDEMVKQLQIQEAELKDGAIKINDITNKLNDVIKQMETEIKSGQSYAKGLRDEIDQTRRQLQEAYAENFALKMETNDLRDIIRENKTRIKELQQIIKNLNKKMDENIMKNDSLQNQLKIQQIELENRQMEINDLAQTNNHMKMRIDKINSDLEEQKTLVQELLLDKKNIEIEIVAAKLINEEYTEAKTDVRKLINDTKKLIKVKSGQDSIIADYKRLISETNAELDNIKFDNKNKTKELENAYKNIECLKTQVNNTELKAERQSKDIRGLKAHISELEKEMVLKDQLLFNLKTEVSGLRVSTRNLEAVNKDLRQKVGLIKLFRRDIDAVAELKKDNDRLRKTDTTLFRIWCLAIIWFVAIMTTEIIFEQFE